MLQIIFVMPNVERSHNQYSSIRFETGEWFHAGLSYYNEVGSVYKNGCLCHKESNWWPIGYAHGVMEGILLGSQNNINIDLQLDEVYIWEVRKPARIFSALYIKDV